MILSYIKKFFIFSSFSPDWSRINIRDRNIEWCESVAKTVCDTLQSEFTACEKDRNFFYFMLQIFEN